ncbi:FtsX-like permease family protein [Amycolatopsis palatopharyngis]|uniref:FtsX-like permease family protein n=1 Tax=Amycolatopsis palatopharyngis TaxID=187982 RepID=UPI000E24C9A6|nr:ABC transporter permease [Amycolatopsis palatopharyngis]
MNSFRLALRVLRVDRRTRTSAILTAAGVAVATALVLLLVALPFATEARADRASWQNPYFGMTSAQNEGPPVMRADNSTDFIGSERIERVDVALTGETVPELPPGVPKFPAPGEALLSPALAEKAAALPASQLSDRFGDNVVGTLGEDAISSPGQLVALVGHSAGSMSEYAVPLPGFAIHDGDPDPLLTVLAGVGVVVLVVPSLVLVGSAARLTAARRERRLAALRLAGATPGQVTSMVTAETAIAATGGALLGLTLSPVFSMLATNVSWDGGKWQAGDFILPLPVTALIVVVMPLLVLAAAVFALRRVMATPLGAAAAHSPKPLHWWRLLAVPAAGLFFFVTVTTADSNADLMLVFLALGCLVGSAAVVGPWVTSVIGGIFVRLWRKPAGLLAGRRLRDDPRGAYRASAGVVLAVFAGSMALTLMPTFEAKAGGGREFQDSVLYLNAGSEQVQQIADDANAELERYGQPQRASAIDMVTLVNREGSGESALLLSCADAEKLIRLDMRGACAGVPGIYSEYRIETDGLEVRPDYDTAGVPLAADTPWRPVTSKDADMFGVVVVDPAVVPDGLTPGMATVAVQTTPENREVVRTALVGAAGGSPVMSRELMLDREQTQLADLRRVTVIGLIAAAMLAGCSAAIATAGSVMDRRRTFGALIAAGTPVRTIARALRMEAALPAMVATVGAGVVGVFVGTGMLILIEEGAPVLTPWILAPIVLGAGVAALAASVCTPALKRVRAEPLADE